MIHIGISGPIASGKSTLAADLKRLADRNGYHAEIVPFAYGVKELAALEGNTYRKMAMAQRLFDWGFDSDRAGYAANMLDQYMRQYPSQPGVKNRRLLQSIGTEVGREYLGADTWVIRTQQIARRYEALDFLISDDMRFDNEALSVDVHIGIDVSTPELVEAYKQRLLLFGSDYVYTDHASEKSLTYPPLMKINIGFDDCAVQELFARVDYIRRLRY